MKQEVNFRPSKLAKASKCIGSIVPRNDDNISTPYASKGTALHKLINEYLINNFLLSGGAVNQIDCKKLVIAFQNDFVGYTRPVEEIYVYIEQLIIYILHNVCDFTRINLYSEIKVAFKDNPRLSGSVDILLFIDNQLHVIDFKTGVIPVGVIYNPQLLAYAAYTLYSSLFKNLKNQINTVHFFIIQPNSFKLNDVRSSCITIDELDSWLVNTLKPMIIQVKAFLIAEEMFLRDESNEGSQNEYFAYYNVSDECKLCSNIKSCKAISRAFNSITKEVEEVNDIFNSTIYKHDFFTDDVLIRVLKMRDLLNLVLEKCESFLIERYENRQPINGIEMIEGKYGALKFLDDKKISDLLLSKGYDKTIFTTKEEKLLTPKQMIDKGLLNNQEIQSLAIRSQYKPKFIVKGNL
jgi:hypothetical protein